MVSFPRVVIDRMARCARVWAVLFVACVGCEVVPKFPAEPAGTSRSDHQTTLRYDVNRDGVADYWQIVQAGGRKIALEFDDNRDGQPDETVRLDDVPNDVTHLVIALDGVPFEVLDEQYQQGHFRLFYPPARMISTFPSMTDQAYSLVFGSERCLGLEALYFDRRANRLSDGNAVYLSGANAPWARKLAYRCSFWWDANAYLHPQAVFEHELRGIVRAFDRIKTGQAFGYTVATAGLATRGARPAVVAYLQTIDRLCEQIVQQRRGQVKLTLLADHGHNLVRGKRVSLASYLRASGFHPTNHLRKPKDVVVPAYGLLTYAAISTNEPDAVATTLAAHPAVELVAYGQGADVVVRDAAGLARIRQADGGYFYDTERGDPLRLQPILQKLAEASQVGPDGRIDDRAAFAATATHLYPDPLHRLWLAFHGLVQNPADVLVSLRDGYVHGSKLFNFAIGGRASTHGSLNRANSTTFVMTMLGPLPPALRPEDVLPALDRLRSPPAAVSQPATSSAATAGGK